VSQGKKLKIAASSPLRTVPLENAFYFYKAIGAPTGSAARNLSDFVNVLKEIDLMSIQFHLGRGDFENWIKTLGDQKLARQVSALKKTNLQGENLRLRLLDNVKSRLDELKKAPM
jgi:hypothetical protein